MRPSTRALSLAEHARDVAQLEVGAEAKRERVALVVAQRRQRSGELIALLDGRERGVGLLARRPGAQLIERPPFAARAASLVAKQVQRDRIQPAALASAARVKALARAQHPLERFRQQVLGEGAVPGAVGEEAEELLGVLLEQPLERVGLHADRHSGVGAGVARGQRALLPWLLVLLLRAARAFVAASRAAAQQARFR